MKRLNGSALVALTLLLSFQGCESPLHTTQIMLVLEAPDPTVATEIATVEVAVAGRAADEVKFGPEQAEQIPTVQEQWPVEVALVPQGGDTERRFRVTATALGSNGEALTHLRTTGKYHAGHLGTVHLRFDRACVADHVLCHDGQTCVAGHCQNLTTTEAEPQPPASDTETPSPETSPEPTKPSIPELEPEPQPSEPPTPPENPCLTDHGNCDRDQFCDNLDGVALCAPCPEGQLHQAQCGPVLEQFAVDPGPLEPAFTPGQSDYVVELPLLTRDLPVQLEPSTDGRVSITGVEAKQAEDDANAWTLGPLPMGQTPVEVLVEGEPGQVTQTYHLQVTRSGTELQHVRARDAARGDNFGRAIALSGNTLAISAVYRDEDATTVSQQNRDEAEDGDEETEEVDRDIGAVYVFERNARGRFVQTAQIVPADGQANMYFGAALALDGDLMLVGALLGNDATEGAGAVYVFARTGQRWEQQAKLTPQDSAFGDWFGAAVALQDGQALVGAPDRRNGAVYVYEQTGTRWSLNQRLSENLSTRTMTRFGAAICLQGSRLVVGAPEDAELGEQAGAAHVYERNAGGTWEATQVLRPEPTATGDWFGFGLACSEKRLAIGAPRADGEALDSGRVFLFERENNTWVQQQSLEPASGEAYALFGSALKFSPQGLLIVGAHGESDSGEGLRTGPVADNTRPSSGGVHIYGDYQGTFTLDAYLKASDPGTDDSFGYAVDANAELLVVGAMLHPGRGQDPAPYQSGAVYIFR